jgi:hypothetical protein
VLRRVPASDIDIVITACSIYCPTPSLSSLLVSQLGLREDIISYSLGGMGCSSGVIDILLARELLQVGSYLSGGWLGGINRRNRRRPVLDGHAIHDQWVFGLLVSYVSALCVIRSALCVIRD